jgi:glycerol-3-phosphate acyltransferase PlsY
MLAADMLAAVISRVAGAAVVGYLLGSFPTADLVSRARNVDLRTVGDRNPGWWNAREALGRRTALPVLVGDIAKGCLAASVGRAGAREGQWWMPYVSGGAAMVGHAWPVFARFHGGRAVATLGGVAAVVSPRSLGIALGAGAATYAATHSIERAIQLGYVAFPLGQLVVDGAHRTAATGALMSFVGLRFAMR